MRKLKIKLILPYLIFCTALIFLLFFKIYQAEKAANPKSTIQQDAQNLYRSCNQGTQDNEFCYSSRFGNLTKQKDMNYSIQVLSALQDLDPGARGCHLIAHAITSAQTSKDQSKWRDLLLQVNSDSCSGGFIHGIIEAHSIYDRNFKLDIAGINNICSFIGQKSGSGGEFNCYHIMGHILFANGKGNFYEAVSTCDQVTDENQRYECYSGIFMENETRDNLVAHGLSNHIPWNDKTTADQEQICRQYSGVRAKACWRELAHMYAFIAKSNPVEVFKFCSRAPDPVDRDDCYFHSVGIMIDTSDFQPQYMSSLCSPYFGNDANFNECAGVAVDSLLVSTPKFSDRAISFCQSIPIQNQNYCYREFGRELSTLVPASDLKQYCLGVPEPFKGYCVST